MLDAAQFDNLVPGLIREKVTWYFESAAQADTPSCGASAGVCDTNFLENQGNSRKQNQGVVGCLG